MAEHQSLGGAKECSTKRTKLQMNKRLVSGSGGGGVDVHLWVYCFREAAISRARSMNALKAAEGFRLLG